MKSNKKILLAGWVTFVIAIISFITPTFSQSKKNVNGTKFKVAAAQFMPVFMDREKTLEKACRLITEASENGARLVVFPEVFIPGYPAWVWHILPSDWNQNSELYVELVKNAVTVPSPTTDRLCEAARQAQINVVIGIDELNAETSNATIYNTILFISDEGELLGKHRKLVPTGAERMVWARGDTSTLKAYDTSIGKLSGLICYENKMPLARTALYELGTQIFAAPTADDSEAWLASMQSNAWEGGMYVINVCAPESKDWIPDEYAFKKNLPDMGEWPKHGNSCIIGPGGHIWAGPLKDQEGFVYSDILMKNIIESKRMVDVVGNYARDDVFRFSVKGGEKEKP